MTVSQKKTWLYTGASSQRGLLQSVRSQVLPASCSQVGGWAAAADKGASLSHLQTNTPKTNKKDKCAAIGQSCALVDCLTSVPPVCSHRSDNARRHGGGGFVRQLHCRAADGWTPGGSDSQGPAVTSGRAPGLRPVPPLLFILANICQFYLSALLGSFICT